MNRQSLITGAVVAAVLTALAADAMAFGRFSGLGRDFGLLGSGGYGKKATPVVSCAAGQLDFTDACGTTKLMVMLR